jgi:hypothetical protein
MRIDGYSSNRSVDILPKDVYPQQVLEEHQQWNAHHVDQ